MVKIDFNWPKKEVFDYFLEFSSLVWANFANNDRQTSYLTNNGGPNGWKIYFRSKMVKIYFNIVQKWGFGQYLEFASLVSTNFAYDYRQTWYLTRNGGPSGWENIYLLKNGQNWLMVFGHFLELVSSVSADFTYDERKTWNITSNGGPSGWKKYISVQEWSKLTLNWP